MFFDAHNHLTDLRLKPKQDQLLEACAKAEIRAMAVNGTHPNNWEDVQNIVTKAATFGIQIYPQFGVHPWQAHHLPADWQTRLVEFLSLPNAGIGETGLDNWKKDRVALTEQQAIFQFHLELATEHNLPISIHCLKAWNPLITQLKQQSSLPKQGLLFHGFGGDWSIAKQLLQLSKPSLFSFCGYMLHPKKAQVQQAFSRLPQENIVLESDAPDMLPPKELIPPQWQDHTKTPCNTPLSLEKIYPLSTFLPSKTTLWHNSSQFFHRHSTPHQHIPPTQPKLS